MLGLVPNSVVLRKVRLRSAERDALRSRQRLERALAGVDGTPPGISPGAVLLVLRLMPAAPAAAAPRTPFSHRVSLALRDCASRARRPWLDEIAAAADAVFFTDEAEVVACLVRDWLRGRVADRWWWRSLLGDLSPREWLRQHVLARGEVLVPAIAVLAAGPDAVAWLARLPDTEAKAAAAVIVRSHALSLDVAKDDSMAPRPRGAGAELSGIKGERRAQSQSAAFERLIATVPEILMAALRPPQRRLVALALTLARAPSWARTPQLALGLQELERPGPDLRAYAAAIPEVIGPKTAAPPFARAAGVTGALRPGDTPEQRAGPLRFMGHPAAPLPERGVSRAVADARLARAQAAVGEAPATAIENLPLAPALDAKPEQALPVEHALRVHTQFGGIFYLLNAALAMRLYGDFTAPRGANLRLSPWDWLALLGRAWFGKQFVSDPVWGLLAGLAGRKGTLRRRRWLRGQIETLLARLALALGEERFAGIPALVCRYPAEIAATASRVDVHLALANLPLALRVAGLDRDPGWIPAAGRSIAFHFE